MRPPSEPPRDLADRTIREALRHPANLRAFLRQVVPELADQLDPDLGERMQDLGERKEFLSEAEHKVLMALVNLAQRRTVEKLRAELALKRLQAACPELAVTS